MIRGRFTELKIGGSRESLRLYSFNLRDPIPEIKPQMEIELSVHNRLFDFGLLQRSILEDRISQGNQIFVAKHKSKPVAYLFATTKNCRVEEIDDWFIINPGEVYLYDGFTMPGYRGNRIYPFLIANAARFFKRLSYSYALIFTSASNIGSIKGIERAGFSCYQVVNFWNFFGLKVWNYHPKSGNVRSRFSNEI